MPRTWRPLAGERTQLFSPIGLRLLDELVGGGPLGPCKVLLELRDPAGQWQATDVKPTMTASGFVSYPALGRRREVIGVPPRRYRITLEADFYRPFYRWTSDGIEFDAHPYNDDNPPAVIVSGPQDAPLLPAPNYPFEPHVPVLRGDVRDAAGRRVPDVLVFRAGAERTLSDGTGSFALALRWVPPATSTVIDAIDQRNGRVGSITVTLPADLGQNQVVGRDGDRGRVRGHSHARVPEPRGLRRRN
jgi:hypothetical protein